MTYVKDKGLIFRTDFVITTINVFFGQEEQRYSNAGAKLVVPDIQLLISFPTEKQAVEWVMANGRDAVLEAEEDWKRPIVLTIIHYNNSGEYHMGKDNQYLTFAFTKHGFELLQAEHMLNLHMRGCSEMIPWWITYVNKKGIITRGWSVRYLCEYHKNMSYCENDAVKKQQDAKELESFHTDPDKYISEQRKKITK